LATGPRLPEVHTARRRRGLGNDLRGTIAMGNGKWVIVGIVGLAIVAAVFSWSYRRRAMRRSMAFWGTEAASLIAHGPRVEAVRLNQSDATVTSDASDRISFDGKLFAVIQRHDMSHARGLTHLRQSLLEDASFDFRSGKRAVQPKWEYAIRFGRGSRTATVLVSLADEQLALVGHARTLSMAPIAAGVAIVLTEQLGSRTVNGQR